MRRILHLIYSFCLAFFLSPTDHSNAQSQCISQENFSGLNSKVEVGQSFTLSGCTSGETFLHSFEYQSGGVSATTITCTIYEDEARTVQRYEQTGIVVSQGVDVWNTLTFSGGTGSLAYTPGEKLWLVMVSTSGVNRRRFQSGNHYSGGELWNGSTWSASNDMTFRLHTTNSNPLPVELTSFTGKKVSAGALLTWQTASEINNEGFEIQHSGNGYNWSVIDFVEGNGTSVEIHNYELVHDLPKSGINYYRLKQIDFDGAYEYSKIINIEIGAGSGGMFFSPNPSILGSEVNLRIRSEQFESGQLTVFDLRGKVVLLKKIESKQPVIDVSRLPKGIYYALLTTGRRQMTEKLIIE